MTDKKPQPKSFRGKTAEGKAEQQRYQRPPKARGLRSKVWREMPDQNLGVSPTQFIAVFNAIFDCIEKIMDEEVARTVTNRKVPRHGLNSRLRSGMR